MLQLCSVHLIPYPVLYLEHLLIIKNLTDINTEAAINLAANDSNVRLLSTPIIMTTDNTEARLSVGEQRPVVTSTSSFGNSSGTLRSSYEYKDIGINLTVTPRINPPKESGLWLWSYYKC